MEPTGVPDFVAAPFTGLRAFDVEESLLFFGRETHTEALLQRLCENRFLAVVGSSGCGKSSLVRAGLLPALLRGYLVNATSRWRFATLRPGKAPLTALATELAKAGMVGPAGVAALRQTLGATSGGLVEVVRQAGLAAGESLLVTVDQFEEIFRYGARSRDDGESAALFVSLLLRAVESAAPIYVAITMRSDYQGDCAQFAGLAEALNSGQYLVPRLTRAQRREAIVRPLELIDAVATPRLVNRLLNDAGDDPDQLPVLQHALLQTYRHWRDHGGRGTLDEDSYDAIGGIAGALGKHGDDLLKTFDGEGDRRLVEKIFRSLTTTERGREIRRPQELGTLAAVVGATEPVARARVEAIVSTFARREHSLVMLSSPRLEPDTVVDITHESLMRQWPALAGWLKEEARSAEWYNDLARDVARRSTGDAGLWRDPELAEALRRRDREGWNPDWARQYKPSEEPPFEQVQRFLGDSVDEQTEERRRLEDQRRKEIDDAQALARAHRRGSILSLVLLVTIVAGVIFIYVTNQRSEARVKAETAKALYVAGQLSGELAKKAALQAEVDQALRELANARPADIQRERAELEAVRKARAQSETSVRSFEAQLEKLRTSQDLRSSDSEKLLARLQELQKQLDASVAERDKLRLAQDASLGSEAKTTERLVELELRLGTATAEVDKLRAERRSLQPPTVIALPQYSIVHLPPPFPAGGVAVGVGDIHNESTSWFRVYVWTKDGDVAPPVAVKGELAVPAVLERYGVKDVADEPCWAERGRLPSCYRIQGSATLRGTQPPATFTLAGVRYQILATGWRSSPDTVFLAIYPAP
jgi:hypothetical protein